MYCFWGEKITHSKVGSRNHWNILLESTKNNINKQSNKNKKIKYVAGTQLNATG